jgi:WD40 repeat protein
MNSLSSYAQLLVGDVLQNTPAPTRGRSKSRVSKQAPTLINVDKKDTGIILKIAQHWFSSRRHSQIEKLFEKNKQVAAVWNMLSSVQNQRLLGLNVPFTLDEEQQAEEPTQTAPAISFSTDVEIVKAKEPIRAFCIDQNNPSLLAYATGKLIREVNITHSIKYRKRNPMLDKIQDEECVSWEASLHRFDEIAIRDDAMTAQPGAVLPSNAGFGLYDFLALRETDDNTDTQSRDNGALTRIKKRLTMTRKPSFNSSSVSQFKQHQSTQSLRKKSGVDHNQSVTTLISHPYLPFYLSGGTDGAIHMFQFGTQTAVRTYKEQGPMITSLRFSRFGYKFGATDANGYLTLYRFEASKESIQTFSQTHCHSRANGFTFLDSASVVATIGVNGNSKNLCIWDLLMPTYDAMVHVTSFADEPSSVLYCSRYNTVMVGTKRGDITVLDVRTKNPIKTFVAHSGSVIETMSLDVTEDFFSSGCSDGDVKIWDMRSLDNIQMFRQAHKREQMFSLGPSGVTDMTLTSQFFYSGGSDGRIVRRTML